jgi:hypothetical protein
MSQEKISVTTRSSYVPAAITLLAVVVGAATANGLQTTDAKVAQPSVHAMNLKVLPKETSITDVYKLMAGMQKDLGVQCGFCHEEDPDSKRIDYASDENPRKETARFMMRMTNDINEKYLGKFGDRQYAQPITCGNCHLGQMHPPPYDPAASK